MKRHDFFSDLHPLVSFLYFALVLLFAMFLMHPLCLLISFASALIYAWSLNGVKSVAHTITFVLPIMLMAIIINTAFSHEGITILTYLPSGNPLTKESILYGIAASFMLGAVVLWFSCVNAVMTTDKLVYLFGRVLPALSLLLSMTLRFVPRFARQFHAVKEAQVAMGKDLHRGNALCRIKSATAILSIMITWSLENAIDTADSMKSRGYGLTGRTAFSIYRFNGRDSVILLWLLSSGVGMIAAWLGGVFSWHYYPMLGGSTTDIAFIAAGMLYLALCFTPLFLNGSESRKWKSSESKT